MKRLGAIALGVLGVALLATPDARTRVLRAARSRLGASDASEFWADTLPGMPSSSWPADWCGAFVLWALHQAGLARGLSWQIGSGFLIPNLAQTSDPKPGDVAYFDHNQHEALIESIKPDGTLTLLNGNGDGGKVTESTVPRSAVTAFFSLDRLLAA